jgi:hypothetical protein
MAAMSHLALAISALVALIGPAPAQDRPPEPVAVLETPEGGREVVRLVELDLAAIATRSASFVRLEGLEPPPPLAPGSRALVSLAGGDRLHAEVRGGSGDLLQLALRGGAELEVVVDRVESVVFEERMSAEARAGLAPAEEGDVLYWLRPGSALDRVPGTLLAFEAEGPRWQGSFGERSFAWSEVGALFIEALGSEEKPAAPSEPGLRPDARVVVDLWDGGRLSGRLRSLASGGLVLQHSPERDVDLGLSAVAEVLAADGRVQFLSDLAPASAEEGGPFGDGLGLTWPHRRDASVTGAPLQAGGRTWLRGIGVHSPSKLTYALDGQWKSLRGSVAIDDQVLLLSARGAVHFRVLVDGAERWSSGLVRGGDSPVDLGPIDLSGARELALVVEMADDHYVADRADWLRPLLVRSLP